LNAGLDHDGSATQEAASVTAPIRVDSQPGREQPFVIASVALLAALCWACLVFRAMGMSTVEPQGVPATPALPYRWSDLGLLLGIWGATLAAVLLPAASPAILLAARISRLLPGMRFPNLATLGFIGGCLLAWGGFGALATLAQWALHDAGALDAGMAIDNANARGLLLVAAGAYQWTPAKHACLQHCRAPLSFMVTGWRPGLSGALRMGAAHGLYCTGCCWLLALLLFAAGITNLAALVALAGTVLAEKLLPGGAVVACIGGLALVAWGTLLLFPQA
jgi:predicted metal-binding membrane protein